jgi:hypothetical protein
MKEMSIVRSQPTPTGDGWHVLGVNNSAMVAPDLVAYVQCAAP